MNRKISSVNHVGFEKQEAISERALVKVSGTKHQINVVLNALLRHFGKHDVLYNYPRLNEKTGFYYVFINIFIDPCTEVNE